MRGGDVVVFLGAVGKGLLRPPAHAERNVRAGLVVLVRRGDADGEERGVAGRFAVGVVFHEAYGVVLHAWRSVLLRVDVFVRGRGGVGGGEGCDEAAEGGEVEDSSGHYGRLVDGGVVEGGMGFIGWVGEDVLLWCFLLWWRAMV